MITLKTYLSPVQPAVQNGLWLKPIDGGYALYLIGSGNVEPINLVDDNDTKTDADDVLATVKSIKSDLVGKAQDSKSKNTINGAKAYAKDQADGLLGTAEDTSADMTLYGLKAYIDSKVPSVESTD